MPRILLSASFPEEQILRQTPGGSGRWGEFQYVSEPGGLPVDGWVVYDNLRQPIDQQCPPQNTLLVTGEPQSLRKYRSRFTSQFGQVWTSHRTIRHQNVVLRNEAQPWHYALHPGRIHKQRLGYDELVSLPCPEKTKIASVICSSKCDTEDHRKRLEFAKMLKQRFGDAIDLFGRGIRDMDDKSEAIHAYKYHIVLENDHYDYFMTEKLPDAFLGWSYPIYFGGPEAYHRFPDGSFTAIDIYKPEQAMSLIRRLISSNTYEHCLPQIAAAREAVLHQNNFFQMLDDHWRAHLADTDPQLVTLLPKNHRAELVMRQMSRSAWNPFSRHAA